MTALRRNGRTAYNRGLYHPVRLGMAAHHISLLLPFQSAWSKVRPHSYGQLNPFVRCRPTRLRVLSLDLSFHDRKEHGVVFRGYLYFSEKSQSASSSFDGWVADM